MSNPVLAVLLSVAVGISGYEVAAIAGQSPQNRAVENGSGQVFRSGVNMVSLNVTVTDARERHVAGLSKSDFAVYEDGKPQEITYFAGDPAALDLAILLDTSGSMESTLSQVQQAAVRLLGSLRPGDRASFTEVKRGMRLLQPLTSDFAGVEAAIRSTTAGGDTAIFQAIYVALRELQRAARPSEVRRQALIVLSDGDDTASVIQFDDVLDAARRSGVAIYCVSLRPAGLTAIGFTPAPPPNGVDGDYALRTLAQHTGGRSFFRLTTRDLARTCGAIAAELAEQYSLGYVPANQNDDGQFRRVVVQILGSAGSRARTRPGYFASAALRAVVPTRQ